MKNKKSLFKIVIIPLVIIAIYFVSEYLLLSYGEINIPNYTKFIVIILCIIISGYNAFKQNKKGTK